MVRSAPSTRPAPAPVPGVVRDRSPRGPVRGGKKPGLETVWAWLSAIPDPEIPAISLTDLGIIRDVQWQDQTLVVTITPTYSGCPATSIINLDIEMALRDHGIGALVVSADGNSIDGILNPHI